jgi:hypothetical protein
LREATPYISRKGAEKNERRKDNLSPGTPLAKSIHVSKEALEIEARLGPQDST